MTKFRLVIYCVLCCSLSAQVMASDLAREARLKNQIVDYILDGEPITLTADNHQFLAIFQTADNDDARRAVILMHGRGFHPNWADVIYPLRTGLPSADWHTLSIQMPVLDNQSTFYDYLDIIPQAFPRIDSAVQYLKQQGINKIVLLAHSCSVHMSVAWLTHYREPEVIGFVGVGMGSTDKGQPLPKPLPLDKVTVPVLDIRGQFDYPAVHRRAGERWEYLQKAGQPLSQQRIIKGADHYFRDRGDVLLQAVEGWLDTLD